MSFGINKSTIFNDISSDLNWLFNDSWMQALWKMPSKISFLKNSVALWTTEPVKFPIQMRGKWARLTVEGNDRTTISPAVCLLYPANPKTKTGESLIPFPPSPPSPSSPSPSPFVVAGAVTMHSADFFALQDTALFYSWCRTLPSDMESESRMCEMLDPLFDVKD